MQEFQDQGILSKPATKPGFPPKTSCCTVGQDPTLPEMRRVRLLEMADAMDMFCQGLVCAFTVLRKN